MSVAPVALEALALRKEFSVSRGLFQAAERLVAVDDVDMTVGRNEIVGIVGESGCGKSTLARLLIGLEPPSAGEVRLDGHTLTDFGKRAAARKVQPVFQDPYSSLNPRRTVGDIVGLPLWVHGIGDRRDRERRVISILNDVGLSEGVLHSYPNQLSGGQRQRVAIARALIIEPEILVCDEPTSALDVSVQAQILNLILRSYRDYGLTIVLISHDLAVVQHLAQRVFVMYLGRVVEVADTERLFAEPKHPYTQALLQSVLTPDPKLNVPEASLYGNVPSPLDLPAGCRFHPRCPYAWERCRGEAPALVQRDGHGVECHLFD